MNKQSVDSLTEPVFNGEVFMADHQASQNDACLTSVLADGVKQNSSLAQWHQYSVLPKITVDSFIENDEGYGSLASVPKTGLSARCSVGSPEVFNEPPKWSAPKCDFDPQAPFDIDPEPIGSGRFGTVLKITQLTQYGGLQHCALKTVRAGFSLDNEQRIMERLTPHPNVVIYQGKIVNGKCNGLMYELIEGIGLADLNERLVGSRLLANELFNAWRFLEYQKFQAVAHIKKNGVVHGDLKPSNFLYDTGRNLVKLCDFGAAAMVGEPIVCGHEDYTAPEALDSLQGKTRGVPAHPAIDAYALGQMLYKCVNSFCGGSGSPFYHTAQIQGMSPGQRMEKAFRIRQAMQDYCTPDDNGNYQLPLPNPSDANLSERYTLESARLVTVQSFEMLDDSTETRLQEMQHLTPLINQLMHPDPDQRISVSEALKFPWFTEQPPDQELALKTLNTLIA